MNLRQLSLNLRLLLSAIYKRFWKIVFHLLFGKNWFVKQRYYSKLAVISYLFEIWLAGLMVRRIGSVAQLKLSNKVIVMAPFEIGFEGLVKEIYLEEVYDRFYRMQSDDVVVDVGAHVGLFTLKVARKVKLVVAVEPHPLNYRLLTMNIAFNDLRNVIPVKLALSNYSGKAKLYLRNSIGHTLKGEYFEQEPSKMLEVDVKTPDLLVDELGLDKVTFIKLDVEGAELDVLRGSEKVLSRNNWLFLAIAAYHYLGEAFEVAKFLKVRGFKVFSDGLFVYAFKPHMCLHTLFRC